MKKIHYELALGEGVSLPMGVMDSFEPSSAQHTGLAIQLHTRLEYPSLYVRVEVVSHINIMTITL